MQERQRIRSEKIKAKQEAIKAKDIEAEKIREMRENERQRQLEIKEAERQQRLDEEQRIREAARKLKYEEEKLRETEDRLRQLESERLQEIERQLLKEEAEQRVKEEELRLKEEKIKADEKEKFLREKDERERAIALKREQEEEKIAEQEKEIALKQKAEEEERIKQENQRIKEWEQQFDLEQNQGLKNLGVLQSGLSGISPLISSTGSSQKKTGLGDVLGAGLQIASLFPFPSDSRLKKAIKFLFELPNGINIYSWEWNEKAEELNIPEEYPDYNIGVIAQEVMHIPNAVVQDEKGFLRVNYEVLK